MSNHLAIATVTATLRQRLQDAVTQDVTGASVEILPLHDTRLRDTQPMLNLLLYHASPNAAWMNEELPVRRGNGSVANRPQLALRLHYILTAFGRATQSDPEPHRLLGSAVRTLHERPILTREEISATVQSHTVLANSDLADQVELVRISPQSLTLEEVSKIWSVFFQTPYRVSLTYEASVVLIDGRSDPQPSLPVRARNIYVVPLRTPRLDAVEAAAGSLEPILPESPIVLRGANLRSATTRLRIGTVDVDPAAEDVFDDRIEVQLPASLPAGVRAVQVIHPRMMGTPEAEHAGEESNLTPFVLRPRILRNAADTAWEVTVNVTGGSGSAPRSGTVTVRVAPEAGREQQAVLLMNQLGVAPGGTPRAYAWSAESRRQDPAETTDTLVFPFSGVVAGDYLLRVRIDGAESPVAPGAGGAYDEPRATVP